MTKFDRVTFTLTTSVIGLRAQHYLPSGFSGLTRPGKVTMNKDAFLSLQTTHLSFEAAPENGDIVVVQIYLFSVAGCSCHFCVIVRWPQK